MCLSAGTGGGTSCCRSSFWPAKGSGTSFRSGEGRTFSSFFSPFSVPDDIIQGCNHYICLWSYARVKPEFIEGQYSGHFWIEEVLMPDKAKALISLKPISLRHFDRPDTFVKPKRVHPRRILPFIGDGKERAFHSAS